MTATNAESAMLVNISIFVGEVRSGEPQENAQTNDFEYLWREDVAADDACHLNACFTWKVTAEVHVRTNLRVYLQDNKQSTAVQNPSHAMQQEKFPDMVFFVKRNTKTSKSHWTFKNAAIGNEDIYSTTIDL